MNKIKRVILNFKRFSYFLARTGSKYNFVLIILFTNEAKIMFKSNKLPKTQVNLHRKKETNKYMSYYFPRLDIVFLVRYLK